VADICDHEFDGEHCEECGIHVSEYIDALRERAEKAEAAVAELQGLLAAARDWQAGPTWESHRARVAGLEAEVARVRAPVQAVIDEWDVNEIGQIDGALIDDLRALVKEMDS